MEAAFAESVIFPSFVNFAALEIRCEPDFRLTGLSLLKVVESFDEESGDVRLGIGRLRSGKIRKSVGSGDILEFFRRTIDKDEARRSHLCDRFLNTSEDGFTLAWGAIATADFHAR